MTCGIYKITNTINNHIYIGLSKNIEKRWSDHKGHINNKRSDAKNKPLYNAMRKYGVKYFQCEVIEECAESELQEKEIYWISYYNSYNNREHYNATPGGDLPSIFKVHRGESHGRSLLTKDQVVFCRKQYKAGYSSREIHSKYFKDIITYRGFCKMWHGTTWKHIMPEVFLHNPRPAAYNEQDCNKIRELFYSSGLNLSDFVKTLECFVGYGTAYKMINTPEFYNGK